MQIKNNYIKIAGKVTDVEWNGKVTRVNIICGGCSDKYAPAKDVCVYCTGNVDEKVHVDDWVTVEGHVVNEPESVCVFLYGDSIEVNEHIEKPEPRRNYYDEEIFHDKYYNFKIFLDTPYVWGTGYGGVSQDARNENDEAIRSCISHIPGWSRSCFEDGDVWYNKFEEVYLHPMEISGCCKLDTIDEIVGYLKSKNFKITKFHELRVFHEAVPYTFTDIYNFAESFKTKYKGYLLSIYAKYHGSVAMNYDFRDFPEIKFKEYCFADNKTEHQKTFLVNYLNECLSGLRKR